MSRHNSQASTGESAFARWLRVTVNTVERNFVTLGTALLFVTMAALGFVGHSVATTPFGRNMTALVIWFSVIFAVAAALLGGAIRLQAAVSSYLADRG